MQYLNRIRNLMAQHPVRINTAKNQAKARNAAERDMLRGKKEPFDVVHYFHPKQNAHHSNDERNKDSSCVMQEFSDFSFCILKLHLQSCLQNSLNHISLIRWAVIPKRIAGIHDEFIDSVCEINEDSAIIRNHGARIRGYIAGFC